MRDAQFERLYAEHAQSLFGFLVYRTGNRALAEDVLADTFERVLRARRGFDRRRGSERTWLYSIALNLVRDQLRRAGAEARALERADDPARDEVAADPADSVAGRDAVTKAIAELSPEEREVVALRFGADLSLKEIAGALQEPVTTVEGRLYRALRKMRALLDPSGDAAD